MAGILYLGSYERQMGASQERSISQQAHLLAAALSSSADLDESDIREILQKRSGASRNPAHEEVRLRVLDRNGEVIADSRAGLPAPAPKRPSAIRRNWLYRAGASLVRPALALLRATEPKLPSGDFYERSQSLIGPEVMTALRGREGTEKRISKGERSVTIYTAVPVRKGGSVTGAVLASQSTFTILEDLYATRLGVVRIFSASLLVAIVLSLLVATTIVGPLRQLRVETREILDRRGRLRGHFRGSGKLDEIGDLSRALERLTRRLDGHLRFIERFASDVSHELKNPLASIRMATEMLYEVPDAAERRRFHRMVEGEIARMESLLDGVRDVTSIDSQLLRERREPIPIGALLTKIMDGFRLREGSHVELELRVGDQPALVEASEERLLQVFENVLDNAVSFSPAGGKVSVEVRAEAGIVTTRVRDQGPGIPEANLPRIFDRFFTDRPERGRGRSSHTGLGLAIVKSIAEGYGGSVTAANAAEGGALFEIRLPLKADL